jgi:dopamine beta-monooxygenase
MTVMTRTRWAIFMGLSGAVGLSACGSSDDGGDDAAGSSSGAATGTSAATSAAEAGSDVTGMTNPTGGPGTTSGDPTDSADSGDESGTTGGGLPDDAVFWELRADYSPLFPIETYYSCYSFNIPVDQLYHIIGFEPVVTNPVIHHYVLSVADGPTNFDPNIPCVEWPEKIIWAWAPGMPAQYLPPDAGFLTGHTGDTANFVLQVHYNNPLLQDFTDTDGINVIATPTLREFRAGVFSQGDIGPISIPPGQAAYDHVASCSEAETMALLTEPVNVFASFLHAHEIGSAIHSEVFRNGESVGVIADETPFDFNSQKFLPADIQIEPGDRIDTTCTYDSTDRTSTTNGGPASDEEMCINFMMYYPWIESETCGSL